MPKPQVNLLITADYELFLGRNFGSHDDVLFEPTKRLITVCEDIGIPITFFADVCSVWAHRDHDQDEYAQQFEEQLRKAASTGHDVQLHLHPHWLHSQWTGSEWHPATDRMYLAELGFNDTPDSAPAIIKRGVDYLTELLRPVMPDYRCLAFRAAGLALQPQERELIASLLEAGIEMDSSVAKNILLKLDTVNIDYRNVPTAANWYLSAVDGINSDASSGLFEIPIATFQSNLSTRLGFLWRRARSLGMRRGAGISRSARQTRWSGLRTMIAYNLRFVSTNPWFSLSCDTKGMNCQMLVNGLNNYVEQHRDSQNLFVSMITHPKLLFEPQLELLNEFVAEVCSKYGELIRFVTCREAADRVRVK